MPRSHIFPLNREIQVDQTVKFILYHSGSFQLFRKSPSMQPSTNMEWVDSENTRIHFKNTLQTSDPQKLFCILCRIRQIFQQLLQALFPCQTWSHWLINFLFTICPVFALSKSKQLIFSFSLYMTLEYILNITVRKMITLSRTMFLLHNYDFFLYCSILGQVWIQPVEAILAHQNFRLQIL